MSPAVIYDTFGGPEVLGLREVPEPHAGPGEVRVRVTRRGVLPVEKVRDAVAMQAGRHIHGKVVITL